MKYKYAALGGTFDRVHNGHKAFLTFAARNADTLIIGLTTDVYLSKNKPGAKTLPYDDRKKELESYLETLHVAFIVTPINSNEIPKEYEKKIDVLVATTDTLKGAEEINNSRIHHKLSPLPIIPFPLLTSHEKPIASTLIRQGQIDRKGEPYLRESMTTETYVLPNHLRKHLQIPIGEIIDEKIISNLKDSLLITVGDITTKTCLDNGIHPQISIIDFIVERVKRYTNTRELGFDGSEHVYHLENKQSTISPGVFRLIAHLFYSNTNTRRNSIIVVSGEEDLIVLPVILLAPIDA